jgi:hypothetical protein
MRRIVAGLVIAFMAAGVAQAQQQDRFAFPTVDDLKTKAGFDDEQCKKAEPIVKEYGPKVKDLADKAKDAQDKKAAYGEVRTLRTEGLGKLKELCKDDDQKKKFDESFAIKRKQKNNNNN